ncbi:tail fiber assembly protein [Pantoea allii]|uniref:tail fiber assembly protein n=1 Tax=Pantoea allii TaxID=574096 RepID=UPI001F4DFB67|nr:tail fiber assembly protein [Pantoea allii]MCH9300555.1 tail fiber assembly protein [Pantoea allii]
MMKILYSASANGFFDASISYPTLPDDLTEISQQDRDDFISGRPGYEMKPGKNGRPKWAEIPALSKEQLYSQAEAEKRGRTEVAMQTVAVQQLKLQAGRKLSSDESQKLNAVLDYIDALAAVDASAAPDITWPVLTE